MTTPAPTAATADLPTAVVEGCQVTAHDSEPIVCHGGDTTSDLEVALVGDSKASQWASAFELVAEREGWHLLTVTKSACALATSRSQRGGDHDPTCDRWNEEVLELFTGTDPVAAPDLVVVSQVVDRGHTEDPSVDPKRALVEGMVDAYRQFEAAGATVVLLLDNPQPGMRVYECVAEHMADLRACTFPRDQGGGGRQVQLEAGRIGGFDVLDMNDQICPTETCLPVIGDVLVYRQGSHLTDTYARSTTPVLRTRLRQLVDGLRAGPGAR